MGGHADGQEASRLAIHCMLQSVLPTIMDSSLSNGTELIETLTDGVQWANQAVYQRNQEYNVDMGTTLTSALVLDTTAYIVNVGDSRTYLYRPGQGLMQITRDHSVVARLVETGEITPEEVYTHPQRNQVYRGLGNQDKVEVDWFTVPLQAGDYLVLCSDGLWEMVRDPAIERLLKSCGDNLSQASNALVGAALQGGGVDNISVIVVHVGGGAR
jgi:serine/threonine protein phosphatase PrpC